MQVDIAASALYLLAAPSTPEAARQEALERACQGERITHTIAKQIRFHHTIDVEAETITNDKEFPAPNQSPPEQEHLPQPETVNEPLPLINEVEIEPKAISNADPQLTPKQSQVTRKLEDSLQAQIVPVTQFEVGDRVRILRRQHGEDEWSGKSALIWNITPDGWLRVNIEGHRGVRFTLRPDWVERVEEETEQLNEPEATKQPESENSASPNKLTSLMSSKSEEHFTSQHILNAVLQCLGEIDLDPCSNCYDSPNIPAKQQFTQEEDGLAQSWSGKVFMNPPYVRVVSQWVEKLCSEFEAGNVTEAIALVASRTDTQWFRRLRYYPRCFLSGRLKFSSSENSAPFPSVVFYLGNSEGFDRFFDAFHMLGDIFKLAEQ